MKTGVDYGNFRPRWFSSCQMSFESRLWDLGNLWDWDSPWWRLQSRHGLSVAS